MIDKVNFSGKIRYDVIKMTETITINVDSEVKKDFEAETGMTIDNYVKLLMDNIKYGGKIGLDPFWSEENQTVLREAIEDAKNGRNMHEHELIEVE